MDERTTRNSPLITFYRFLPGARAPERADRSAAGSLPTRAFRYCEAITTASAFGWYVFPPMTFSLMWDGGTDVHWTFPGADGWYPLTAAQFPDFSALFDEVAPESLRGYSPPFLGAFKDPSGLMLWSGFAARTAPGWSLLIRPPANLAHSLAYESYEGIVETDRWFGPLFTNLKLTRPNVPIEFDANYPILQVQPVERTTYGDALENYDVVPDIHDLTPSDWEAFGATIAKPHVEPEQKRGHYAKNVRRRRKKEVVEES